MIYRYRNRNRHPLEGLEQEHPIAHKKYTASYRLQQFPFAPLFTPVLA